MAQRPRTRAPHHLTRNIYDYLFRSGSSLSKPRDAIRAGRLLQYSDGASIGVPGRSLAWKLLLLKNVPLEPPPDETPIPPLEALRAHRKQYSELLLEKMRAPDGSYDETFVVPGVAIPRRATGSPANLETNNPLSLHDENPWREWFTAVDLRKTIRQDVERTFPDIGYFRDEDVQQELTNILFLYSVMHPDIEYRQGMHELLAPVYYAVDYDSESTTDDATPSSDEPVFREFCSREWIAADSWSLFCVIMDKVSKWYEWREPPSAETSSGRGQVNLKPYVLPINVACNHMQNGLLKSVDPVLHGAMQNTGIEPQFYGLRWLRLLFTREFSIGDAMVLWDGLFASPIPISELAQWVCVAMLIRIRTKLIPSDYSMQLTYLLRYPPCSQVEDGTPHHAVILLRQALSLQMSRTPSAGTFVMTENRNLLNIPLEVPDPPVEMRRRVRIPERGHSSSSDFHGTSTGQGEHIRQSPSSQMGLPELIARGLLDRGESLGINKTVMNAVSEIRRNLPELAASLVRTPSMVSTYPLLDEQTLDDRLFWEHERHLEVERATREKNKRLSESVTWILSVLQPKDSEVKDEDNERILVQQKEALESLTYVRDILGGEVEVIDERRLWGMEEYQRRLEGQNKQPQETKEPSATQPRPRSMTTAVSPANEHPSLVRQFSPNTSMHGSLRPTSVPLQSSSIPAPRTITTHNRSHSSNNAIPLKLAVQRTPLRLSSSNPFQRAPDTSGIPPVAVSERNRTADQTPKVRSEVHHIHDPLGALK